MVPENSTPRSQQSITCPYPHQDKSSSRSNAIYWKFILILFSYLRLDLASILFLSRFIKTMYVYIYIYTLQHTCYMPRPSQYSWFVHPNNIWSGAQIMKLIAVKFVPISVYLIYHRLIYLPQSSLSSVFLVYFISFTLRNRVSHPYKKRKIIILCILIFTLSYGKG